MKLNYTNKKGKKVHVDVHPHALDRFKSRFYRLYPNLLEKNDNYERRFRKMFENGRIIEKSKKYKKRDKKHGSNTVYIKNSELTFVVQNQIVKTVEISAKNLRHLNKRRYT